MYGRNWPYGYNPLLQALAFEKQAQLLERLGLVSPPPTIPAPIVSNNALLGALGAAALGGAGYGAYRHRDEIKGALRNLANRVRLWLNPLAPEDRAALTAAVAAAGPGGLAPFIGAAIEDNIRKLKAK